MKITASRLFGRIQTLGNEHCFYCGTECAANPDLAVKIKVAKTFTNHDEVKCPSSQYICEGCAESLSSSIDLELLDGEKREKQWIRLYSWIITWDKRIAATKTHIPLLRDLVCNPPEPPFAIVLSDAGKKQLIFRAPVALDSTEYPVMLEESTIIVNRASFPKVLEIADYTASMVGKTGLLEPPSFGYYAAVAKYVNGIDVYEKWLEIQNTPIARLAAWLAYGKGKGESQCQLKSVPKSSENHLRDTKVTKLKEKSQPTLFEMNA